VGRFEDEGWRVRKDGTRFFAKVVITALRDTDATLRGFAKVTRDISERRAHEQRIERLTRELEGRVVQLAATNRELEQRARKTKASSTACRTISGRRSSTCRASARSSR